MLAMLHSAALQGVTAEAIQIEVNTGESGEPHIVLVGLPDTGVKESEDRVSSAIGNSGFKMPQMRTTINLAPGHIRKEGPMYDLPIALGILQATEQLHSECLADYLIAGELSLSGATRPVRGGLAMARLAKAKGCRGILLPAASAPEAALVEGLRVYSVDSLDRAVRFLNGEEPLSPITTDSLNLQLPVAPGDPDFSEIKGQASLRRAVEVAVSGGHNLLVLCAITRNLPFIDFSLAPTGIPSREFRGRAG